MSRFLPIETPHVLRVLPLVNELEDASSLVQTFPDEGKEHSVLFLFAAKKATDMPIATQDRTRQPDLPCDLS